MRYFNLVRFLFLLVLLPMVVAGTGCPGPNIMLPDVDDVIDDVLDDFVPLLALETYATNTGGAGGMALRPSDGALFIVNSDGLYGPIEEGDDVSTLTPIGATNLADDDLFGGPSNSIVLAITNSGEFWIGSECCVTVAVVPAEGGDAVPFAGLLEGSDPSNIRADTMAIVPDGFDGEQIDPGNLLIGEDTTFSRLAAIDVEGDRAVVDVDNPGDDNREAHHLAFGPDGVLYSAKNVASITRSGFQTIAADGTPTTLPGTTGASAKSFVVRNDGDLIIRGDHAVSATDSFAGLLIWSAADQTVSRALELSVDDRSEDDEMVIAADGTIYLTLLNRSEIVRVVDAP